MKGIEGAKKYFEVYGNILKEQFPDVVKYTAFGLCGQGSECLGFDDEISRVPRFRTGLLSFPPRRKQGRPKNGLFAGAGLCKAAKGV